MEYFFAIAESGTPAKASSPDSVLDIFSQINLFFVINYLLLQCVEWHPCQKIIANVRGADQARAARGQQARCQRG